MLAPATQADYDPHVWRDDTLYGMWFHALALVAPNPGAADWASLFILDIDHIVAWDCAGEKVRFRVAPADLIFREVCDLEMAVDLGNSNGQVELHEPTIDRVTSNPVAVTGGLSPLFNWQIVFNHPTESAIGFRARGFHLKLRCDPVLRDEQRMPVSARA
ncbi:MAG: hypothetical protein ACPGQM_12350 [Alphaproteobacteria bacterium]